MSANPFAEVDKIIGQAGGGGVLENCTGANCGDALANYLNSGPLKDTGTVLPRGGIGPGDLASVGKARGSQVYTRDSLTPDVLTPGTVIHMTRQPGDRNYEYGKTHIGMVDVDENGNSVFKSFTAGKGWRSEPINQRFLSQLPAKITATNPVNPDLNPNRAQQFYQALKNPGQRQTPQQFPPYQIASVGDQIPAPPSNPFAEVDNLISGKQLSEVDALIEGKTPTDSRQPGGFLAPKQGSTLKATPTPLYEMGGDIPADFAAMKEAVINPPNMGYRPGIVRPILQAAGMGLGGATGAVAGAPLGPAGVAGGTIAGGTLGYGMAEKAADAADSYLGNRPVPTLKESLTKTVTEDLPTGLQMTGTGEVGGPALKKTLEIGGKVAKPFLGRLSGTGVKNIDEALKGGEAFTNAMRGKISGEDVVQNFKDAVGIIKDKRAAAYQEHLANIAPPQGTTAWDLDMFPIRIHLRDLMKRYNVKISPEGVIDTSEMAMDKAGRDRIVNVINEIWEWKDKSPLGLDALKRRLNDFYSESNQARAFVTSIEKKVKDTITSNVPEYEKMLKDYSDATSFIKDIETGLMTRKKGMTGRVTADMTLRRVISAMRDNFALRGELADALGAQAAMDLSGQVAGYNMRSVLPHGIAGTGPVLAGEALLAKFVNPKIWPLLIASSPRVQGEFLKQLGKVQGSSIPVGKITSYLALMPKPDSDKE